MGKPKGGKNRKYSVEEKMRIVKLYINDYLSYREIEKQEKIPYGTFVQWIYKYLDYGDEGLINKPKTGNKFSALTASNLYLLRKVLD